MHPLPYPPGTTAPNDDVLGEKQANNQTAGSPVFPVLSGSERPNCLPDLTIEPDRKTSGSQSDRFDRPVRFLKHW
jgi:hypothetical protein